MVRANLASFAPSCLHEVLLPVVGSGRALESGRHPEPCKKLLLGKTPIDAEYHRIFRRPLLFSKVDKMSMYDVL